MLDALDAIGIHGDGRLLALNSYENRVYQVWRDDEPPWSRSSIGPTRWSDAQIHEEHAFVAELAAQEIPVVAPLDLDGGTLHSSKDSASRCIRDAAAAHPSSTGPARSTWIGRFLGRIHATGSASRFVAPTDTRHRSVRRRDRAHGCSTTANCRTTCATSMQA